MDETYVKVRDTWVYLYRAVDKQGFTVDFYLSPKRDVEAAKQFLRKAIKNERVPTLSLDDAPRLVGGYVEQYNNVRLNRRGWLHHAEGHTRRASAGDSCRQ